MSLPNGTTVKTATIQKTIRLFWCIQIGMDLLSSNMIRQENDLANYVLMQLLHGNRCQNHQRRTRKNAELFARGMEILLKKFELETINSSKYQNVKKHYKSCGRFSGSKIEKTPEEIEAIKQKYKKWNNSRNNGGV